MTSTPAAEQHLRDLPLLRQVRDRMDREYAQPLDVEALARGVHMSAGHLSRQFKQAYGESPYSYLMTRRIERAMALLRRGDLSVTEVCFAVGCQSLGTFSTRFTELVGVPPSVYMRESTGGDRGDAVVRGQAGHQTGQANRSGIEKRSRRAPPSVLAMDITIYSAFLPHDDRDAAVAFYCDTLGFELRNDVGYNGMHWLTVGPPNQPGRQHRALPAGRRPGHHRRGAPHAHRDDGQGHLAMLTLATDDLDGLFEKLQASDAEVMQEPTDQHYGVRDCAFRDPAGNIVRINQVG